MDVSRESYRRLFILVFALASTGLFLFMVRDFLVPVFLAAIFAALLYPAYRWMLRVPRLRRRPALTAAALVLAAAVCVGVPLTGFVGLVTAQAVSVAENVAPRIRDIAEGIMVRGVPGWLPFADEIGPYVERYREPILARLGEAAGDVATIFVRGGTALTRGALRFLLDLFVMLYALYFFVHHGPRWMEAIAAYLPLREEDRAEVLERGLSVIRATLKSILVIGVLQGALIGLALWFVGIGGALFWGAIVVVLSALPAVGPSLVWGPASLFLLLNGSPVAAVGLAAWGAIVVGLLDNVLRPRIVSAEARLPDLLIFLAMLGGIGMFGVSGLLIGPVVGAVMATSLEIYRYAYIRERAAP